MNNRLSLRFVASALVVALAATLSLPLVAQESAAPITDLEVLRALKADPRTAREVDLGDGLHALVFDLPRSGEFFVQARPLDPETAANPYALSLHCIGGCDLDPVAPGHVRASVSGLDANEGVTVWATLGAPLSTVPTLPAPPACGGEATARAAGGAWVGDG